MTRARDTTRTALTALGGAVVGGASLAAAATLASFRATNDERRRALPGDRFVPAPLSVTTQAVTIDAPPERVWPWLAQMGADRGGWYSYDRVDNRGRPSATSIRPELQHVTPGDVFPAVPGATDAFVVAAVEPPRDLVLAVPGARGDVVSWEFHLAPVGTRRTRLLVRARVAPRWLEGSSRGDDASRGHFFIDRVYRVLARLPAPLMLAAGGLGHRVMQNRQLRNIRRRAEGATHAAPYPG